MKINPYILLITICISCILSAQTTKQEAIQLFEVYESKSEYSNLRKEFDSMAVYLQKMDALLPLLEDSAYTYRADLIRGAVLTRKTEQDKAMQVLFKATEFFALQKDYRNFYRGRYNIGICYYYLNRKQDAKNVMKEILENKKYVSEDMEMCAISNIAALKVEQGMHQEDKSPIGEAIIEFGKVINVNRKKQRFGQLATNYSLLAEAHNQIGEQPKSLIYLDSAVYFANKDKNLTQKGFALVKKANILTQKKLYAQAKVYLDEAIETYKNAQNNPTLLYAYVEKKKLYTAMKNYRAASETGDSIYKLTLNNFNKRFADGISEMETKYKTAEKEREILEQRAAIAENERLLSERNYQIYGALAFGLVLFFIAYLLYNQQKLKNRQLIKENELRVALKETETQNKLQEQRLRISRDLHDNIGAQLSFIISSIDNLKYASQNTSEEYQSKLTYISEFTSATIDQLRDTIWAMNKNEITITDLQSRVLALIEKAKTAKQDIKFEFMYDVTSDIVFSSIEGMHLFRVIQEAINNALKYSEASVVKVQFLENEKYVCIHIEDNGVGFKKETVQLGNGLYNMQQRMDEINAAIDIKSEPQKGTEIAVKYIKS